MLSEVDDDFAVIVFDELLDELAPGEHPALVKVAELAASVRRMDLHARAEILTDEQARIFIRGTGVLSKWLFLVAGRLSLEDTLARDVVRGALATINAMYPDLYSELWAP